IEDGIGIVRDEILLARTELREEVVRVKSGLIAMVSAAIAGVLAVIMILNTIAWGAAYAFEWPTWAGFAVVALPLVVIAAALAMLARSSLSHDRYMPKSIDTLKENAEWIRARTQS